MSYRDGGSKVIVHIIPKTTFTNGQISFLDEAFGSSYRFDHWVYGPEWKGYGGVDSKEKIHLTESLNCLFHTREFLSQLRRSDAVLVDWVDFGLLFRLLPYLSKTALLFWGGELYPLINYRKKDMARKAFYRMCLAFVSRAHTILTLTQSEFQRLEKVVRVRGSHALGSVASTKYDSLVRVFNVEKTGKRILVGNSATPTNRHREVFELLSRFRNDDIEVYVPLSYGDEAYKTQVLESGKTLLGDIFYPIVDYMPKEDYMRFLSSIDVGIFNHDRQQALGNIYQLLASGAKLYLADDGDTLPHLKSFGFHVCPTSEIIACNLSELLSCTAEEAAVNKELCSGEQFYRRNVEIWRTALPLINSSE